MNGRLQITALCNCGTHVAHEKVFNGVVLYAEINDIVWFSLETSL